MELLIVVTLDKLAAMKLLAATCLIHSFIAERVGPYIMWDWVGLAGKGGEASILSRNGASTSWSVLEPGWVTSTIPGCTALAFHSIEVQSGIQRCIEAVTDWRW